SPLVANSRSPSALRLRSNPPGPWDAPTATKQVSGKGQSSLNVPPLRLFAARSARLPENVAALARCDEARGDEQVVGEAVEVGEELRIERLGLVQRDGSALGSARDSAGEVQGRYARGSARQDEAGQWF